MIASTVCSRVSFDIIYRGAPSSRRRNIVDLIPMLTIRCCPRLQPSQMILKECIHNAEFLFLCEINKELSTFVPVTQLPFSDTFGLSAILITPHLRIIVTEDNQKISSQ